MSKTPFEIRLDLLSMAQSVLNENNFQERQRLEADWHVKRELAIISAQKGNEDLPVPPFPTFPIVSEEDIIRVAKKLNDFVSNNITEQ